MPKINDIFWVIWYLYLSPNQQCNTTKGQKGLKWMRRESCSSKHSLEQRNLRLISNENQLNRSQFYFGFCVKPQLHKTGIYNSAAHSHI